MSLTQISLLVALFALTFSLDEKKQKCKDFLPPDWNYDCLSPFPIHNGLKTKIFEVTKGSDMYTLKVLKFDPQASNELSILQNLRNTKYVPHIYNEKQLDNHLIMILDNGKYDNLYKAMHEKSEFKRDIFKLEFFRKIISAVDNIHKALYSHNELSPENILVLRNLDPMIIDYKNAIAINTNGKGMSTPVYSAPESMEAFEKNELVLYDEKIDVFALGAILYIMFVDDFPVRNVNNYDEFLEQEIVFPSKTPRIVAEIVQGCYTLRQNRLNLNSLRRLVDKAIGMGNLPTLGIEYKYQINSFRKLSDDYFFQKNKNTIFIIVTILGLSIGLFFVFRNWNKLNEIKVGVEIKERKIDIEKPLD